MSTINHAHRLTVLLIVLMFALSGCGMFNQPDSPERAEESSATLAEPAQPETSLAVEEPAPAADEAPAAGEMSKETIAPAEEVEVVEAEEAPVKAVAIEEEMAVERDGDDAVAAESLATASPLPTAAAGSAVEVEPEESTSVEIAPQSEPLRAGEVDDNARWDEYLLYRRNYSGPQVHHRDISERYVVEVVDGQGRPVLGATVRFYLPGQQQEQVYSARTYANGQVLFHPLALDMPVAQADRFQVEVEKDSLRQQFSLTRFDAQAATGFTDRWTVTLDRPQQQWESLNLDVLFLIDATGSMADEIAKIQSTIFDVSAQIDALPENPNVRYGMVTYRDRDDSFVTRTYEFTPDVRDFSKNLNTVYADGGGDYPESLNEALHDALHGVEWRGGDTVQLIFLIADAPPHLDYAQDYDYAIEMETAARRGVKIFPIASSGLDDQGEYIFRQIAQYTQGRFIFLTYDGATNGGAPGDETTHHVDDYSVENLDDLLVRLVEEELAFQNPQLAQAQ